MKVNSKLNIQIFKSFLAYIALTGYHWIGELAPSLRICPFNLY